MKKTAALLLAVLMALAALAGCSNGGNDQPTAGTGDTQGTTAEGTATSTTQPQEPQKDTLTIGITLPIDDFNPLNQISSTQGQLFTCLFSTLVYEKIDENGMLILAGDLAENWENINEGKTWRFELNPSAVFSNGQPVTAEDVKYTFEKTAESPYLMSTVDMVREVEVIDDHTVEIHMDNYNARAPYCWASTRIVNAALYEADLDTYLTTLVGSGPYVLKSVDAATGNITMERNEEYWGEKPQIREITMRVISDASTMLISLESGQIDMMSLSAADVEQAEKSDKVKVTSHPTDYGSQVIFNVNQPPFDNKLLRQAIAHAINFEAVAQVRNRGHYKALSTIFYMPLVDSLPDGVKEYDYNPDKARELLAQAGIETPYDIGSFLGGSGGTAELIQQNLADVGLVVTPEELEPYTFIYALLDGNFGIAFMGGQGNYPTAAEQFAQFYMGGSQMNLSNYDNPAVNDLIDALMKEPDETEKYRIIKEILDIVNEDAPYAACSWDTYYTAGSKDLHVPVSKNGFVDPARCHW